MKSNQRYIHRLFLNDLQSEIIEFNLSQLFAPELLYRIYIGISIAEYSTLLCFFLFSFRILFYNRFFSMMGLGKRIIRWLIKIDFMNANIMFNKCAESSRIKPRYVTLSM